MATVATINIEWPVVVLPLEDYERLLARIEDLEDALALQEAKAKTTRLRPYREFREELVLEERGSGERKHLSHLWRRDDRQNH
ncbi:MAG: hypothetical protein NWE82_01255 [Candidatus Bathyarchaeota archaeon]|nr:hypothetical protein [Candidatus Bathyarchaeota archaeon]